MWTWWNLEQCSPPRPPKKSGTWLSGVTFDPCRRSHPAATLKRTMPALIFWGGAGGGDLFKKKFEKIIFFKKSTSTREEDFSIFYILTLEKTKMDWSGVIVGALRSAAHIVNPYRKYLCKDLLYVVADPVRLQASHSAWSDLVAGSVGGKLSFHKNVLEVNFKIAISQNGNFKIYLEYVLQF